MISRLTKYIFAFFSLSIISFAPYAQNKSCLTAANLIQMDAQYELALQTDNYAFLEKRMHPSFVWIHNHASSAQNSRAELVEPMRKRVKSGKAPHSTQRTQDSVQVLIANSTAVLHGFTVVERASSPVDEYGKKIGKRYHFMRTYYEEDGKCYLMANHTMLIPEE